MIFFVAPLTNFQILCIKIWYEVRKLVGIVSNQSLLLLFDKKKITIIFKFYVYRYKIMRKCLVLLVTHCNCMSFAEAFQPQQRHPLPTLHPCPSLRGGAPPSGQLDIFQDILFIKKNYELKIFFCVYLHKKIFMSWRFFFIYLLRNIFMNWRYFFFYSFI